MNLKFYIAIALVLFIVLSSALMGYVTYTIATAKGYTFKSDDKDDATKAAEYLTLKDKDSRGVSAQEIWKNKKYFVIAPHIFNLVAMAAGGYLIYNQ